LPPNFSLASHKKCKLDDHGRITHQIAFKSRRHPSGTNISIPVLKAHCVKSTNFAEHLSGLKIVQECLGKSVHVNKNLRL
jgi:hypothetical protein